MVSLWGERGLQGRKACNVLSPEELHRSTRVLVLSVLFGRGKPCVGHAYCKSMAFLRVTENKTALAKDETS